MNLENKLAKLFAMLPDNQKKQEVMSKYKSMLDKSKKRGGEGLQDTFELKPKGHIMIEAIDEAGNVIDVLADQPNLVVDGAEEILLRAFSGDPNRILYKNRTPKDSSGLTGRIYISNEKLNNENITDGTSILHAPNALWAEVDDTEFDISYGYYPTTLFLKEEVSTEVGKKAFTLSTKSAADRLPLSSEVYSSYTNMFIGIGEGKNAPMALTSSKLVAAAGVVKTTQSIVAATVGQTVEFTGKISNFAVELEKSANGAQVEIYVNNALKETINTQDAALTSPEVIVYEFSDLTPDSAATIRLKNNGGKTMKILAFRHDELHTGMNKLMGELKNYETDFSTPAAYNTTPIGPFTVQLPNFPVIEGSVKVTYDALNYSEVDKETPLTDTTFHVDHLHGVVTFNRALSGVMATYKSTGEIHDYEMVETMKGRVISVEVSEGVFENRNVNDYTAAFAVKAGTARVLDHNGVELTYAEPDAVVDGTFSLSTTDNKVIVVSANDVQGTPIPRIEVIYKSDELPGVPSHYKRAVIDKPKTVNEYPWFELDKGAVKFVAEFPESTIGHNITIREMGLFDGPRVEDEVPGFRNYPVKAFSLVRVGETRKDVNTGIRITWTITLLNADGEPFKGGL